MAAYQDPRKAPKPELRRVTAKPGEKPGTSKRPAPKTPPKPRYSDWAMF